jgi:RNA polymerase sigma factor (sigma-70 family)
MSERGRIRAGDPAAFGRLFDEHSRAVYNHAFRLNGDWSLADDITALTFLEAWRLRAKVQPDGGSLRPWLLGIATNVARNTTRAARRHAAATARMPSVSEVPDFAEDLVTRIDDAHRLRAVHEALGKLSPGEQDVFALCVWAGLDYAAAAQALRLPVGTVRSRLSRARRKLQNLLSKQEAVDTGEPAVGGGQIDGDCENAIQPPQEMTK